MRAVTFQSMARMSSPGWYSRTSSNSIPWPLNTLWYSPEKTSFTIRRVVISMRRTFFRTSARLRSSAVLPGCEVASAMGSGHLDVIEDLLEHRFRVEAFRLGFVGDDHPVAEHVEAHCLDVVGCYVAASAQERVCARRLREEDGGARRAAVRDQMLDVELERLRIA